MTVGSPMHHSGGTRDYTNRQALNSLFGEAIAAIRHPDVLVQFPHNVIPAHDLIETTTGGGAITVANATALLSGSGASTATLESKRPIRYQPGFDGFAYFTAAFADTGNTTFQLSRMAAGSVAESVPIVADRDFARVYDRTKLNIYRMNYAYLGVAPQILEVYGGFYWGWRALAVIEVLGEQLTPSMENPALPICMEVKRGNGSGNYARAGIFDGVNGFFIDNDGGDGHQIRTCSWCGGRVGGGATLPSDRHNYRRETATLAGATEVPLFSFRAKTSINSVTSHILTHIDRLTCSTDGTKITAFYLTIGGALTGDSFADLDGNNSGLEYDNSATAFNPAGATTRIPFDLGKTANGDFDIRDDQVILYPGETITVSVASLAGNTGDAAATLFIHEEF